MAEVPSQIASALDTNHPAQAEDYTDWEIDAETSQRLDQLEAEDTNTEEDWNLKGSG